MFATNRYYCPFKILLNTKIEVYWYTVNNKFLQVFMNIYLFYSLPLALCENFGYDNRTYKFVLLCYKENCLYYNNFNGFPHIATRPQTNFSLKENLFLLLILG